MILCFWLYIPNLIFHNVATYWNSLSLFLLQEAIFLALRKFALMNIMIVVYFIIQIINYFFEILELILYTFDSNGIFLLNFDVTNLD